MGGGVTGISKQDLRCAADGDRERYIYSTRTTRQAVALKVKRTLKARVIYEPTVG